MKIELPKQFRFHWQLNDFLINHGYFTLRCAKNNKKLLLNLETEEVYGYLNNDLTLVIELTKVEGLVHELLGYESPAHMWVTHLAKLRNVTSLFVDPEEDGTVEVAFQYYLNNALNIITEHLECSV